MRWIKVETADGFRLLNLETYSSIKADPDFPTTKTIFTDALGVPVVVLDSMSHVTAAMTPVLNDVDFGGIAL